MTSKQPHGRDVSLTPTEQLPRRVLPDRPVEVHTKPIRFDLITGGKHRVEGMPIQLPGRPNPLQSYQVMLYGKPLHPELFTARVRRTVKTGTAELEGAVAPGRHMLRFETKGLSACEMLLDHDFGLPEAGLVSRFLAAGEHEFEHRFERAGVNYMLTVQTESLSENLYIATYEELLDYGKEVQGLVLQWTDPAGKCLSMLDLQRYAKEAHAHCYHMVGNGGLVIRTQTIFELD
jgi:hypothetical protein